MCRIPQVWGTVKKIKDCCVWKELNMIVMKYIFQKIKRIFGNTFLCCKVNIFDSETLCITFSPFKII